MAVTGWKYGASANNADRDGKEAWFNVNNALSDDASYAQCDTPKDDYTDWLRITNFSFDGVDGIPSNCTVDGISRHRSI